MRRAPVLVGAALCAAATSVASCGLTVVGMATATGEDAGPDVLAPKEDDPVPPDDAAPDAEVDAGCALPEGGPGSPCGAVCVDVAADPANCGG